MQAVESFNSLSSSAPYLNSNAAGALPMTDLTSTPTTTPSSTSALLIMTPPGSVEPLLPLPSDDQVYYTTEITDLFPEVMMEIFKKLPVKDLGNVARTCRTWNAILNDNKRLWRGVEAKIHIKRSPAVYQSLNRRGITNVQVLSLKQRGLRELTSQLPNISSLKLSGCYSVDDTTISGGFSMRLEYLTHLNLSLCKKVTDVSIGRIASMAVNLQSLDLGGCSQITNRGLLLISWGLKRLTRLNLRSCYLVTDTGIGFLAGNVSQSHLFEPKMNDFLVRIGLLDPPPVMEQAHRGGTSVMLDPSGGGSGVPTSNGGSASSIYSRNLLTRPHHPPPPVKKYRLDSNGLAVLGPQQCAICKQDIPVMFDQYYRRKRPATSSSTAISTSSTSSTSSSSSRSSAAATYLMMMLGHDASAAAAAAAAASAASSQAPSTSSSALLPLMEKIGPSTQFGNKNLQHLVLQDCQKLSDDCLLHLTHLPNLQAINLSFCVHITDSGLRHLCSCESLNQINLRSCDNVSDIGLANLTYELANRVTSLDVSFCDKIGNSGLNHVALFSHLKELSMSACDISDQGLIKIASSLTQLETLNIGQCASITDVGLTAVAEKCSNLKYIDLYGCGKISRHVLSLFMQLPKLENLNLGLWTLR